jgi:hypothetical protein
MRRIGVMTDISSNPDLCDDRSLIVLNGFMEDPILADVATRAGNTTKSVGTKQIEAQIDKSRALNT